MDEKQNAFQINREDNVATALTPLVPGPVELRPRSGSRHRGADGP